MLGDDIQELSIQVTRVSADILHCKIGAPGRWEVPKKVFKVSNITGASWLLYWLHAPGVVVLRWQLFRPRKHRASESMFVRTLIGHHRCHTLATRLRAVAYESCDDGPYTWHLK